MLIQILVFNEPSEVDYEKLNNEYNRLQTVIRLDLLEDYSEVEHIIHQILDTSNKSFIVFQGYHEGQDFYQQSDIFVQTLVTIQYLFFIVVRLNQPKFTLYYLSNLKR